jgi:hypothetical protein
VIAASACGWNDLGTPRRVATTLRLLSDRGTGVAPLAAVQVHRLSPPGLIDLASQHARLALVG